MLSKEFNKQSQKQYPLPPHFDPEKVGEVWRVPYDKRASDAVTWAKEQGISPVSGDDVKIALILIDLQNTFCIPGFELFVGGRSGSGAVDDNRRLCAFIYRNLGSITRIIATMDTHRAMQIFHPLFLVDAEGNYPSPLTQISREDVATGKWRFNSAIAPVLGITPEYGQKHLLHYTQVLQEQGKYELTIWPFHAMLGGIGHALVSSIEEAIFFHTVARSSQPDIVLKGEIPITESYSAIGPEVLQGPDGGKIGQKSRKLLDVVKDNDVIILAGQAKSHCVAWTISDLLHEIDGEDQRLARKIYLLEDCTSPVVVPGVVDYSEEADLAFARFRQAGMNIVRSTQAIYQWPGILKDEV